MPSSATDLPRDPEKLAALVRALQAENEQLCALVKCVAQQAYGTRSERSSVLFGDQGLLDLQDFGPPVAADAASPANDDEAFAGSVVVPLVRARRKRGERALPVHLERIETVIEPASLECSCCQGTLHRIGEDASEALDWVPAIVRVIQTIRPRYGCRKCLEGVTQAPMPARAIPGSMVTTSTLAWSIPLNRQLQMLAGQGVVLDRSTPIAMGAQAQLVAMTTLSDAAGIHSQPAPDLL